MKTERNILVAFLLNAFFSVFELIGGIFTGSVAIVSDAVHDLGDALSIGLAYLLEKKSKKQPDNTHTYGYTRYSVLGALITSTILVVGSVFVILNAINRLINPVVINYNGMIIFAIIGATVNFLAAYFTREGDSLNQKAVNLHMLEDVLGWVIVLIGAVAMKFTDFSVIDPVLSIIVAVFIMVNALKSYKAILDLFFEKVPAELDVEKVKGTLMKLEGVEDVHHIHIWSMDGVNNYATMHIVSGDTDVSGGSAVLGGASVSGVGSAMNLKKRIKDKLNEMGVSHVTLELEGPDEECTEKECLIKVDMHSYGHCHYHHHHSHGHQHSHQRNYVHQHMHCEESEKSGCDAKCCCTSSEERLLKMEERAKRRDKWYTPS